MYVNNLKNIEEKERGISEHEGNTEEENITVASSLN